MAGGFVGDLDAAKGCLGLVDHVLDSRNGNLRAISACEANRQPTASTLDNSRTTNDQDVRVARRNSVAVQKEGSGTARGKIQIAFLTTEGTEITEGIAINIRSV